MKLWRSVPMAGALALLLRAFASRRDGEIDDHFQSERAR